MAGSIEDNSTMQRARKEVSMKARQERRAKKVQHISEQEESIDRVNALDDR